MPCLGCCMVSTLKVPFYVHTQQESKDPSESHRAAEQAHYLPDKWAWLEATRGPSVRIKGSYNDWNHGQENPTCLEIPSKGLYPFASLNCISDIICVQKCGQSGLSSACICEQMKDACLHNKDSNISCEVHLCLRSVFSFRSQM